MRLMRILAISCALLTSGAVAAQTRPPHLPDGSTGYVPLTECYPAMNHQYRGKPGGCFVSVDREHPGAVAPVTVHSHTFVQIQVTGRKPTEIIVFTETGDYNPPPDVVLATLKQIAPGLGGISGALASKRMQGSEPPPSNRPESPAETQDRLYHYLLRQQTQFAETSDQISCFTKGQVFDASLPNRYDTQQTFSKCSNVLPSGVKSYDAARKALLEALNEAASIDLLATEVATSSSLVAAITAKCYPADPSGDASGCPAASAIQASESRRIEMNSLLAKLQTKQAELSGQRDAIAKLYDDGPFLYDVPRSQDFPSAATWNVLHRKKTKVIVTAYDVLTKESTTITTVEIDRNGSNFILSTGILLSSLRYKRFTATPNITNGVQDKDAGGNLLSHIAESDTVPSVVTPLALVSYECFLLPRTRGQAGVSVSAGIGANLYTTTADYAVGLSLRYKDALFTPLAHFGRQAHLTNGFYVDEPFSGTPPSLTTDTAWKPSVGLAITWRIPF